MSRSRSWRRNGGPAALCAIGRPRRRPAERSGGSSLVHSPSTGCFARRSTNSCSVSIAHARRPQRAKQSRSPQAAPGSVAHQCVDPRCRHCVPHVVGQSQACQRGQAGELHIELRVVASSAASKVGFDGARCEGADTFRNLCAEAVAVTPLFTQVAMPSKHGSRLLSSGWGVDLGPVERQPRGYFGVW